MNSDARRVASYTAKTSPTTVGLKIAARLAGMKTTYAGGISDLVAHQMQVAAILDTLGIVGLMRGRYHAYGNRLHKITRQFSGLAATNMAQLEHDRWESVCQDAILIQIALDVYSLTVT